MPPQQQGIDLMTLLLTAVASASAAYITAKVWAPGTLASAAMTPVIVALVKEGLRKPTEVVTAVVPTRAGRSRTQEVAALPDDLTDQLRDGAPPPYPPPRPGAATGPVNIYSTRARRLRWRLAVLTGMLGFIVCVVVYTVPEVIAGRSVGRPGHSTTLFSSGSSSHSSSKGTTSTTTTSTTSTPAQTDTQPTQTVTQTVTTPAAPPATQTTPPAAAAPAPQQTTTPATPPAGDGTATTP
jgi:hypothetical protein